MDNQQSNNCDTETSTSRFLDIIMVTIDSDMSRKWTLLKIDKARVSINARIIFTSSKAAQYLQCLYKQMNHFKVRNSIMLWSEGDLNGNFVCTLPPIIIFQGHQHLAADLSPQKLFGVMKTSLDQVGQVIMLRSADQTWSAKLVTTDIGCFSKQKNIFIPGIEMHESGQQPECK